MQLKNDKLESALKLNFEKKDDIWLKKGTSLRRLVGFLGMTLPLVLFLYLLFFEGVIDPLESISHYYYTRAGTIFTMVLSLLAVFLILYKSHDRLDFWLSTIAGIAALIVALVPTTNLGADCSLCSTAQTAEVVTFIQDKKLLPWMHYGAAAIFFACLSFMLFFLFTKSSDSKEFRRENKSRKTTRNRIYRTCAVLIVAAILAIAIGGLTNEEAMSKYKITYWMEFLAIISFGIAWFIKGDTILKDKPDQAQPLN